VLQGESVEIGIGQGHDETVLADWKPSLGQPAREPLEMRDRLLRGHPHRDPDHGDVAQQLPQGFGGAGSFCPAERETLGAGDGAQHGIEGSGIRAVEWMDGDRIGSNATEAQVDQYPHRHDGAAHTRPDDVPGAAVPDLNRLTLDLLEPRVVLQQTRHAQDPVELEHTVLAAKLSHAAISLHELRDGPLIAQTLQTGVAGMRSTGLVGARSSCRHDLPPWFR